MTTIIGRIKQIIDYKRVSERFFCKEIGVANGFLSKVKDVGSSKLNKILYAYPDINPIWLLTGEGEMLRSDHDQQPVASAEPTYIYRSDPKDQEIIELQRKHIKLLEDKLSRLEDKTLGLGIAPSVDFTPPLMGAPANPSVYRSPRKK